MLSATADEQTSPTQGVLRIAIIEDERDIRESLAVLINGTPGFRCIARYGLMETALANVEREHPDLILTDLGLPGISGVEGIARLRKVFPSIPILVLTIYDNDDQIFAALCGGCERVLA
jgi:DNA-binding NarL/FixJ family response regulator